MTIIYDEKVDKEMFAEVNRMGKKLSPIFGYKFPTLKFDKRLIPLAEVTSKISHDFIDENKLKMLIQNLYGQAIPDLVIYINTTPFSSWNLDKKQLLISYGRNNELKFFSAVCHEANHLMYDLVFKTKKYQDTEIKESLTVLNNLFELEDPGWNNFSKQRREILDFYHQTKDFSKTLAYARSLSYNK